MVFKPKLTPYEAARMVTDVANGMSHSAAGRKYGVSPSTVLRYRRINEEEDVVEEPQPCGTNAAYMQHLRVPEPPCEPCSAAHSLQFLTYKYEKQKAKLEKIIRRAYREANGETRT